MQYTMLPRIRYIGVGRMLLKQKETVHAKVRTLSKSHVINQPPQQWANGVITLVDPQSIPAIQATSWSPEMDAPSREPRRGRHFNVCRVFLYQIQNHKQAWSFLKLVDRDGVPSYYNTITLPMDFLTIEELLIDNLKLFFYNCRLYNDPSTIYVKCAAKLE
ncbi:hypothetical protein HBH98_002450 [Parastagonospora nodorum]|nr:hypothetical protein HBH52_166980 [Parastagonospora nodorum]KAH3996615.1 hypothetical protein HBI10_151960 [Parastagonospora nodorum]KAH4012462.1 hypothetical protein HBI13_186650 [Parastagonospora nodorum]KAH4063779.1 hypothetical protein HBH50_186590 [Parastagonospora nodorum]KAH4079716.1 hypothetical protein HBH48_217620 [Parastagonospora nodorum]